MLFNGQYLQATKLAQNCDQSECSILSICKSVLINVQTTPHLTTHFFRRVSLSTTFKWKDGRGGMYINTVITTDLYSRAAK